MHTRRKFLIQGSMATTAMLALKPLKTVAGAVSKFSMYNSSNKLVFLHTAIPGLQSNHAITEQISNIRRGNTIALQAGQAAKQFEPGTSVYDSCMDEFNDQTAITGSYKIISKGNIKTGIVSAGVAEDNVIEKVNNLSAWLKKEKGCTVVVCLSRLGYNNNNNSADDISLAKKSTNIDLIIGGNTKNFHRYPVILLNRNNEEVIIHAATVAAAIGRIDIDFNEKGQRKYLSIC